MDAQDMKPSFPVGHRYVDEFVESPGAQQCWIKKVRPVGGPDYHDPLQFFQAIYLRKKGVDHPFGYRRFTQTPTSLGGQGVQLVEEYDGRGDLSGAAEQAGDLLLGLAIPLGKQIRRLGSYEIGFGLPGYGLSQEGLAGAWRAKQQEPFGGLDANTPEGLRMPEGQFDTLPQGLLGFFQVANIIPVYIGHWIMISRNAEGWTRFRALKKSSHITRNCSRISDETSGSSKLMLGSTRRRASKAASRHRAAILAPTNP